MELLYIALIGLGQAILTEAGKYLGIKKEYVLIVVVLLVGVLIAGYQHVYGQLAWEAVVKFTAEAYGFATAIYLIFVKPAKKRLNF